MLNAELEFFIMLHLSVFSAFNSSFNIQNSTFSIPNYLCGLYEIRTEINRRKTFAIISPGCR